MLITEYRLDLIIQALRTILPLEHPADTTLRYFFKNERIGSNEREIVAETVFGVLRHRLLLEIACTGNPTPRRMALAHLVRFGGYNLREIEPVLKRDEKEWLATVKGLKVDDQPLSVQAELPEWLVEKMRASYSDVDILKIGQSMQQGAPLDIRVNTILAKRDDVLQQLRERRSRDLPPLIPLSVSASRKRSR
jgi:16S rRNA (cytosine967-C5)-methyltransferase